MPKSPVASTHRARLLALALGSLSALIPLSLAARVVDSDAPVRSAKRGVGANALSTADVAAFEPGLSWYYNWGIAPLAEAEHSALSYVPMVWNNDPAFLTALKDYLATHRRPLAVFQNNEPNLRGQSFITPEQSAILLDQVRALATPYGVPVVGPHMALGSSVEDSISAFDPILGQVTTYTFMLPFLDAYIHYAGASKIDGLGVHCYGNRWENWWITEAMATDYNKPIWVTEFDLSGSWSARASLEHMMAVVDRFESNPSIKGYAWFKERLGGDGFNSLLAPESGRLTRLGRAYVDMPVHDADLRYRLPGRLQAERYLTATQFELSPTSDVNGLADMASTAAGASLDYQVLLTKGGRYQAYLRSAGSAGAVRLLLDGVVVGQLNAPGGEWITQNLELSLAAGQHTLSLAVDAAGLRLNWFELQDASSAPSAPLDLAASPGNGLVTLSWQPAPGASGYRILRKGPCCGGGERVLETTALTLTDMGLGNGSQYTYRIAALRAGRAGKASEPVTAIPSSEPKLTVLNTGFEEPYTYSWLASPPDGDWSFGPNTGVAANSYGYTSGNALAPEGRQVCYIQSDGRLSQVLRGLSVGARYEIHLKASQRCGWGGTQGVSVRLDELVIGTIIPPAGDPAYSDYVVAFTASSPVHTLSLSGTNWGDNTALVDDISILRL